jgi:hypothetical protein
MMRLSEVAFAVQAALLPSGAFSAFHMNKFGRSNNDSSEYDSDASNSESGDAVPSPSEMDKDSPDAQKPREIAVSAGDIARRITG